MEEQEKRRGMLEITVDLLASCTSTGSLLFQRLTCLTQVMPGFVPIDTKQIYQSACLFVGHADGLRACFFVCLLPAGVRAGALELPL